MKFHPKQQYTILFQLNFISEVYLLQEKSYLTFYTGQNFWRALYHCIHWAGAAQILSQALLKVLPEGVQVNLRLVWN